MLKLCFLAVAVLFLSSIAGDVFFVHHELNSAFSEAEHSIQYILAAGFLGALYFGTHRNVFSLKLNNRSFGDNAFLYFCGWHSSAYVEGQLPVLS